MLNLYFDFEPSESFFFPLFSWSHSSADPEFPRYPCVGPFSRMVFAAAMV